MIWKEDKNVFVIMQSLFLWVYGLLWSQHSFPYQFYGFQSLSYLVQVYQSTLFNLKDTNFCHYVLRASNATFFYAPQYFSFVYSRFKIAIVNDYEMIQAFQSQEQMQKILSYRDEEKQFLFTVTRQVLLCALRQERKENQIINIGWK